MIGYMRPTKRNWYNAGEKLTDLCRPYSDADLYADRDTGRLYWY